MIRSKLPLTTNFILPYLALLGLYLIIAGGGATWLYLEARQSEAELLTDRLQVRLTPLVERLSNQNGVELLADESSWLNNELSNLYRTLPELREVSIRDSKHGHGKKLMADGNIINMPLKPLADDYSVAEAHPAAQRLHLEAKPLFFIGFDFKDKDNHLVRIDFGFSREGLLARMAVTISTLVRSIIWFSLAAAFSILIALGLAIQMGYSARKIEAQLQSLYRHATTASQTAALVHELRNPLASIRANIKNLLIVPENLEEIVDEIDHDLLRLNNKLEAFLGLTRMRNEPFQSVDIAPLLTEAGRIAKPVLQNRGLQLVFDIAKGLPPVPVIPQILQDAILNLLLNAAESGQKEGNIHLSASLLNKQQLQIIVADRGKGIPDEHKSHIFEPFYTSKLSGHGLGLSIAKRTVNAHEGKIYAEKRQGGGTNFIIELPLQHKEQLKWWKQIINFQT
jgi:signal transduction histidine kinase